MEEVSCIVLWRRRNNRFKACRLKIKLHTCLMNNDNICYPYVVGGLQSVLRYMMLHTMPGVKITDKAAYLKEIEAQIASNKESSKEYYRPGD